MSLALTPTLSEDTAITPENSRDDATVYEVYLSQGGLFRAQAITLTDANGDPFTVLKIFQKKSQGSFAQFCNHWLYLHRPDCTTPRARRNSGVISVKMLARHHYVTFSYHQKNPDGTYEREGITMETRGKLGIIVNIKPA